MFLDFRVSNNLSCFNKIVLCFKTFELCLYTEIISSPWLIINTYPVSTDHSEKITLPSNIDLTGVPMSTQNVQCKMVVWWIKFLSYLAFNGAYKHFIFNN